MPSVNSFLITGTSSGLGKYLHDNLGGISLHRDKIQKKSVEIIIHCAFNSDREPKNLDQYYKDNVLLTEELTKIAHEKFIFISSVDVYPKNANRHVEDEIVDVKNAEGLYAKTKLLSEDVVKKNCPNFLILRCSALLGKDSKKNSLIKIIKDDNPTLTLSEKSIFNYIFHSDVLSFIKLAIEKDLQGIYNLASSKNITLKEVSTLFKKKVTFGNFIYSVGYIDNSKATSVTTSFEKTSEEVIRQFLKQVTLFPLS